jgi:hypothetical protein
VPAVQGMDPGQESRRRTWSGKQATLWNYHDAGRPVAADEIRGLPVSGHGLGVAISRCTKLEFVLK